MSDETKGRARTSRGIPITDESVERLADEAEKGYAPKKLRRRAGRPSLGSEPADVVPVRLDSELKDALSRRAGAEGVTVSEVIRRALRDHLLRA